MAGIDAIRFSGLASGLDTGAIVEALMDVERQPLRRIQRQRDAVSQKQALFQELNGLLLRLRGAARALDNRTESLLNPATSEEFLAYLASSADESVVAASADGNAAPGSYDVQVNSLATVGRRVTIAYASPDSTVTSQPGSSVTVTGGADPILVNVEPTTTLAQIASAINTSEDNDGSVSASVLFDGTQYRLVVSGTQTGAANDVEVLADFGPFLDAALTQTALDADLTVLGVPITRAANQISDAIPGLSLDLRGPGFTQVSVSRDDDPIVEQVQELVDAYNAVRDFSVAQSAFDETSETAGPLSGDLGLRTIEGRVQSVLSTLYDFGGDFDSLGRVGISFDRDGRLALDTAELSAALDSDPLGVRALFSGAGGTLPADGSGDGAATALARVLEPIVRPLDGFFAERDDRFEEEIRVLDESIQRFESRLEDKEKSLVRQFAALESFVASLQAQSSFLQSV